MWNYRNMWRLKALNDIIAERLVYINEIIWNEGKTFI